jgi:diketogulonate reductase-like aldo/keto reductase
MTDLAKAASWATIGLGASQALVPGTTAKVFGLAPVDGQTAWVARLLGVSNVSLRHLQQLAASGGEVPAFVQNRCFAQLAWDHEVRAFCRKNDIAYQGFSLLTANPEVLRDRVVASIAQRAKATPAQVVFRFAQLVGMVPLTGTSKAEHMKQDLASRDLTLSADEVEAIEWLVG